MAGYRRKRKKSGRRDFSRDWRGQPRRHKWAAELGWRRKKRKHRTRRDATVVRGAAMHNAIARAHYLSRKGKAKKRRVGTYRWSKAKGRWVYVTKRKSPGYLKKGRASYRKSSKRKASKRAYSRRYTTKRKTTKRRKSGRHGGWFESRPAKRHAGASRKGWRKTAKKGWKPKKRSKKSRDYSRDWKGHHREHGVASHKGWRKHAYRGWKPKKKAKYSRYFR